LICRLVEHGEAWELVVSVEIKDILNRLIEFTRHRFEDDVSALINEALERERSKGRLLELGLKTKARG
jgi:hypothetical protein